MNQRTIPVLQVRPVSTPADREDWNDLAAGRSQGQRHQCLWWMEPLQRYGFRTQVLAGWREDRLVGGALLRSYGVPFIGATVTECLDGPIFSEWETAWAGPFVSGLIESARRFNSMAVILRNCPHPEVHRDLVEGLRRAGITPSLQPAPDDAVLPLEGRTMDQIRSGFNRGTRQRIKKAQAGPLSIRRLTSREDLAQAHAAWMATATRKAFTDVRPWLGLEPVLRHCIDQRLGFVLGSFLDGRLLAAAFIVQVGQTSTWVYGGYMDGAEKHSPTHVLQYEAIRQSLEQGFTAYNFGNLISKVDPGARGVDEFKLGFGAAPRPHLDTIVWPRRPLLYASVERVRQARMGRSLEALFKRKLILNGDARELKSEAGPFTAA